MTNARRIEILRIAGIICTLNIGLTAMDVACAIFDEKQDRDCASIASTILDSYPSLGK